MAKDHIHICIRIPPKYAVSKTVGYPKGKSALILSDHHPEWKTITGRDKTFWARGYFVSTIGMDEAVIRKYVREQEDASRIVQ